MAKATWRLCICRCGRALREGNDLYHEMVEQSYRHQVTAQRACIWPDERAAGARARVALSDIGGIFRDEEGQDVLFLWIIFSA